MKSPDYKCTILLIVVLCSIYAFYSNEVMRTKVDSIASSDALFPTGSSPIEKVVAGSSSGAENQQNNHTYYDEVVKANNESTSSLPESAYPKHSDVIYGHIHMAKTGGTALNGFLANNYERVCGHKGYSYDAYKANERFIKTYDPNQTKPKLAPRDRVGYDIINEIGFEDCDYVSNEINHRFWRKTFSNFHNLTMELHLPCRDPIDHLMSQCNHRQRPFECRQNMTDVEVKQEIKKCFVFLDRYGDSLKDNFNLKCYNFRQQFTGYVDYISTKLQPRRLVSEYKQRETNLPRVKEEECIWKDEELQQRVRELLIKDVPYYRFCNECIGSDDDITKGLA